MKIIVMKFGGTSLCGSEERSLAALRVVSAREQGASPVVVVSAMGRTGAPYATDSLIDVLRSIDPSVDPDSRELDLMMACGEILSAATFAHTLKTLGHPGQAFRGGQAGIRTDGVYGNARILGIKPVAIMNAVRSGLIPVVCGFQGVWVDGGLPGAELTTLGRGGSDTTAAALGAALQAEAVEIYTDVDGVKTADPSFVPHAPTLRKVTYDEVAEIAHQGAKVLHPRAAEIGMRFGIPIWVKNLFTDDPGTEVVPKDRHPGRRVTGVAHAGKLVYVQFDTSGVGDHASSNFEAKIYRLLARHGFNLHMVNRSAEGIGFAIDRLEFPAFVDIFDGLVVPAGDPPLVLVTQVGDKPSRAAETQIEQISALTETRVVHVEITESCTTVSLVGQDYMQQPGVFYRMLRCLADASVPVLQVGDGDASVSCLIPESELRRAVALLHQEFELSEIQ